MTESELGFCDKKPLKFNLHNQEIVDKISSNLSKDREEARRELILCSKCNHKPGVFFKYSSFKSKRNNCTTIFVERGKFFTSYKALSILWNCSIKQTRNQIKKWVENHTIEVKRLKDSKNFDIGLLITYKWLYNKLNEKTKLNEEKKGNRENTDKTQKQANNFLPKTKKGNHNKEVNTNNIHGKLSCVVTEINDVFLEKNKNGVGEDKKEGTIENKEDIFEIKNRFKEIGVNIYAGNSLLKQYNTQTILQYLDLLNLTPNISNKAGWLTEALRRQYSLEKVETWKLRQQEEEKEQELLQQQEQDEIKQKELQQKQKEEQDKQIEMWIKENGERQVDKLYLEQLEELKNTNRIVYSVIMKGKKPNQDLIDFLKSDPFVRVGVRSRILEKVKCKERERLRSETTEKMEYENIEFGVEGNINLNFKVEELENGKYELVENQQRNLEQKYGNFLNRFELKFKTMGGGEIEKRSEEIKSKIRFKNDKLKVAREFENDKILTKRVGEMSGNFNERLPNI